MNEIEIVDWPETDGEAKVILASGKGFQGFCSFGGLEQEMNERFGACDVWYTERNGDPIGMVVPAGTPDDALPSMAMGYLVFEWIKPDKDFGSGVIPMKRRAQYEAMARRKAAG